MTPVAKFVKGAAVELPAPKPNKPKAAKKK